MPSKTIRKTIDRQELTKELERIAQHYRNFSGELALGNLNSDRAPNPTAISNYITHGEGKDYWRGYTYGSWNVCAAVAKALENGTKIPL